jgi:cell division protein FtsQ
MSERMVLWDNAHLMNRLAVVLLSLVTLTCISASSWWLIHQPMFSITSVDIEAAPGYQLRHVSSPQLRASSQRNVGNNFFTVNLDAIRAHYESVPWVRRASIRRVWPNHLSVAIEEHQPMAVWGDAKLVNTFGELYSASITQAEEDGPLPVLRGPDGNEALVIHRFEDLRRWLSVLGRTPETVALSSRHAWTVTLDDETRLLLGRDQNVSIEERVKRWAAVFPRVQERLDRKAEVIDLRYPNGFAIRSVAILNSDEAAGLSPEASSPKLAKKN